MVYSASVINCRLSNNERVHYTPRLLNPLTPNDLYRSRTAPLTSKRCILHIYSTNIGIEYFKHCIYFPFFFSSKCSLFHNSNLLRVLFTVYIQGVLKLKKIFRRQKVNISCKVCSLILNSIASWVAKNWVQELRKCQFVSL